MALTKEQLVARRPKIGGSDVPAILGKDPYRTAHEVALRIRGEIAHDEALDNADHIFFGNEMEGTLAKLFMRKNPGVELYTPEQVAHPEHPFLVVNIDRRVKGKAGIGIECKNTGFRSGDDWGEPMTDQVPERVLLQCAHGMMICPEIQEFFVLRCYGGNAYQQFVIPRNNELCEGLLQIELEFYQDVMAGKLPDPDWGHASTKAMMKRAYRDVKGTIEHLPELDHWTKCWEEAAAKRLELEKLEEGLKNHIEHMMGNNEIGILSDGRKWRRALVKRKAYTVDATQYIECRLLK